MPPKLKSRNENKTSTPLKTLNHAAFSLHYHVILTIKYRNRCINAEMLERMREVFTNCCKSWRCTLVEFNGEADHVHLLKFWNNAYAVVSAGRHANIETLLAYIQDQEKPLR